MNKVKVTTSTGFKAEVDPRLEDDFDYADMVSTLYGTGIGLSECIKHVIGDDVYERLKKHCRGKDGFLSSKRVRKEFEEITNGAKVDKELDVTVKNS